jgi:hypothetical protein
MLTAAAGATGDGGAYHDNANLIACVNEIAIMDGNLPLNAITRARCKCGHVTTLC